MNVYDLCPICGKTDQRLRVTIHLMDQHLWSYETAMEWFNAQEKKEAAP